MAVPSSSPSRTNSISRTKETKKRPRAQTDHNNGAGQGRPKRTKSPGVRLVGGRIYDSENGKTCHQCRQKTMGFTASCKNQRTSKPCPLWFCRKCLLNRYGEKAEVVALKNAWSCPKCRDICNCSQCMKKKGHKPTGVLLRAAKATGFNSASELIQVKGIENLETYKSVEKTLASPKNSVVSTNKPVTSNWESKVVLPRKIGNEDSFDANLIPSNSKPVSSDRKTKKVNETSNASIEDNACSKKNSPKRPYALEKVSEKEMNTKRNDDGEKCQDAVVKHASKERKTNSEDCCVGSEMANYEKCVSNEVSPCPIASDNNDSAKNQDVGVVLNYALEGENGKANTEAYLKPHGITACSTNHDQTEADAALPPPQGNAFRRWVSDFFRWVIGFS